MNIEIDQSVKIEETNKATVLAFSNDKEYAILILGKTKRALQELFRVRGKPRIFIYETFAAGIVLLLKNDINKYEIIIIDQEYPGKNKIIKNMIYRMLTRFSNKRPEILFKRIGKKSKAHGTAHHTTSKERKPDRVVKFDEIKKLIFTENKSPSV